MVSPNKKHEKVHIKSYKAYKMLKGIIEINPSLCFIDDAIIEVCDKTKISCLQIQEQAYILSQIAKFER